MNYSFIRSQKMREAMKISERTTWVWFNGVTVFLSLFVLAQIYGLFIGIPSDSIFTGFFSFVYGNTLGLLEDYSDIEVFRLLCIWGLLNFLLYAVVSVISYFMTIMLEPYREGISKFKDIAKRLFLSIKNGPAYVTTLIADGYFERYLEHNRHNTLINKLFRRNKDFASFVFMSNVIGSYVDLKTEGVTNILTLKIRLLDLISLVLWGIYPFIKAIKKNIEKVVSEIPADKQVEFLEFYIEKTNRVLNYLRL